MGLPRRQLALLGLVSISAGVAEAGVVALVVQAAASLSSGTLPSVSVGPVSLGGLGITTLLTVAVALALLRAALGFVLSAVPARLASDAQARLQRRLLAAFLSASWATQADEREGHLQETATSQAAYAMYAARYVANAVSAAVVFLALAFAALAVHPLATVAMVTVGAMLFGALRPLARRARTLASVQLDASLRLAEGVSESARVAQELSVNGVIDAARCRLDRLIGRLEGAAYRTQLIGQLVPTLYQNLSILVLVGGLAGLHIIGTSDLASLGAVVLLLIRAMAYGQQFQTFYHSATELNAHVDCVLDSTTTLESKSVGSPNRRLGPFNSLVLDDLSFEYAPNMPVLRHVSLRMNHGEALGVVGPSGAGKSTLIQLLLRLRSPSSGCYLVNGHFAEEYDWSDWHRRVAYLPQDPQLVSGTVADNIRFFRPDISDADVEKAACAAGIYDEILRWPDGFATVVGHRAKAVSGGQRQRLCLARAIVHRPDLLVLDEPTSALDLKSELAVRTSLDGLKGRLTMIIAAHRESTIALCDRVIEIEQ